MAVGPHGAPVTHIPAPGFTGTDVFDHEVTDGAGARADPEGACSNDRTGGPQQRPARSRKLGLRSPCLRHPEHRPGPGSSPACPPRPPRS
ncbi:Ig-like domain-containing protein [Actinoplanes sp. NPDC051470]|uniref:Ig-like domain-containing protein n=1 Tax=Actinoplanes sp. NPDC051470 TaxID=3157224 RepID=UPI00344906EE